MTQKENPAAANGEASETDHATKLIDSEITPEASTTQAARNLVGLQLRLPQPCPKCCGVFAQIGGGRGPHEAYLRLLPLSRLDEPRDFRLCFEAARQFGPLTHPIRVHHRMPPAAHCADCGDTPEQQSFEFASPDANTSATAAVPALTNPSRTKSVNQ